MVALGQPRVCQVPKVRIGYLRQVIPNCPHPHQTVSDGYSPTRYSYDDSQSQPPRTASDTAVPRSALVRSPAHRLALAVPRPRRPADQPTHPPIWPIFPSSGQVHKVRRNPVERPRPTQRASVKLSRPLARRIGGAPSQDSQPTNSRSPTGTDGSPANQRASRHWTLEDGPSAAENIIRSRRNYVPRAGTDRHVHSKNQDPPYSASTLPYRDSPQQRQPPSRLLK